MKYSRGSEWNRWEFHIHTPETLKNDNFEGHSPTEKWEKFYQDIKNYIGDGQTSQRKIVAMGVTDYLSIKNYLKIIDDNILSDYIPFIFPNVELRITPIAKDSPINIHCLFNPAIAHELESRFFGRLNFYRGLTRYSAAESELIRLGKEIDPTLSDESARNKAAEQFVIPHTELQRIFKEDPALRQNTIVVVCNKSSDGASGIANPTSENYDSQLHETRSELYRMSDAIFSSSQGDIDYFLGKKPNHPTSEICQKYGKLIPCIHGSDAHTNSKIFEPDQKRYCWIKAVPSFEGMKEIIFEPYSRVRIQELMPEVKSDYYVIDHVVIDDENFLPDPIPFSDKLTCLIGGKSTGKSLLLHNMAEAIDPQQVKSKMDISHSSYYAINEMKVVWRDNFISKKKSEDAERKIVYLPQSYLNKLSDSYEEKTEIDEIIQEILLQNEEIASLYRTTDTKVKNNNTTLYKRIFDLISTYEKIGELKASKLEKGDTASVQNQIQKLLKQKDALIQENKLSEEEINSYDECIKELSNSQYKINILEKDQSLILSIQSPLAKIDISSEISTSSLILVKEAQEEIASLVSSKWLSIRENILKQISSDISKLRDKCSELEKKIIELRPKIEGNAAIIQLSKEIALEEHNLEVLKSIDEKINIAQLTFDGLLEEIANLSMNFYYIKNEFAVAVNRRTDIRSDELEFIVDNPFRLEAFFKKISEQFNNKKLGQVFNKDKNGEIDFANTDYDVAFIKDVILKLLKTDTDLLKKGITKEDAIRSIAADWYNITYTIRLDGDAIEHMSPGKKALVLLKLLINLAESKCPILIDQPEDDLDNRSVYVELVDFIRTKKIDRQIILVTHNANIVVGCDSEEVIVANQRGNNSPNQSARFEYRTGAIEDVNPLSNEDGTIPDGILYKTGIQQHICEILEGGKEAFDVRRKKYTIN